MIRSPLSNDLNEILTLTPHLWNDLRGANVFLTGGTGFFGSWLTESFLHANRELKLDARLTILTRDKKAFLDVHPHLKGAFELTFYDGDIRTFAFPTERFSHVIHAATEASEKLNQQQPQQMRDVIIQGTQRTLAFAADCQSQKFLFVSSGAVYGKQRSDTTHLAEDDAGIAESLVRPSAYTEGKRAAEQLCHNAADKLHVTIARGFSFVGPNLPFDRHFVIGNFIQDALSGRPILVKGDGTAVRSYLYASDLAIWLWTILLMGKSGRAYNVGSEQRVNISTLAHTVTKLVNPTIPIQIMQKPEGGKPPEQYVPSTARARNELGLQETVALEVALQRTIVWAQRRQHSAQ